MKTKFRKMLYLFYLLTPSVFISCERALHLASITVEHERKNAAEKRRQIARKKVEETLWKIAKKTENYTNNEFLETTQDLINHLVDNFIDIEANNEKGETLLYIAVKYGNEKLVKHLLRKKANIETVSESQDNLLHLAAKYRHINILKLLIEKGVKIEARNNIKNTPLHLAVYFNNIEAAEILLNANADTEAKDQLDHTPLHFAAINDNIPMVKLLLNKRARKEARRFDGKIPYDLARNQNVKKLLEP